MSDNTKLANEPTTEASIIAEGREVAMAVAVQSTIGNMQKHIVAFGIACYTKGQDDANALTARDAIEKDREVNQMAEQMQELNDLVERLKLMMSYRNDKLAVLLCDCGLSALEPEKRKAMIHHQYECAYRQFVARREGEPAPAKDDE